jgi:hypothetical protein
MEPYLISAQFENYKLNLELSNNLMHKYDYSNLRKEKLRNFIELTIGQPSQSLK